MGNSIYYRKILTAKKIDFTAGHKIRWLMRLSCGHYIERHFYPQRILPGGACCERYELEARLKQAGAEELPGARQADG